MPRGAPAWDSAFALSQPASTLHAEFSWPAAAEKHAQIHRMLDSSWGTHGGSGAGKGAARRPQHQGWVELVMSWRECGSRSWRRRAGPDATLTILVELRPPPCAITGADGHELSDRWNELESMVREVRALWDRTAPD